MKKLFITSFAALTLINTLNSCKSQAEKDAELKTKIEAAAPGVAISVNNGVVTLNGEINDDLAKSNTENIVKGVPGVKSVVNNLQVQPPVIINQDQEIINAMSNILNNYSGINGAVNNGEITLTGEIKRGDLQTLMQSLNSINPKKINNHLVIK